jgi:mannose/fructose/N-acetylgalactosamine-specific phosphotransferase system component IIB
MSELNLGGIRLAPGKEQIRKSISLGADDRNSLSELRRLGVTVYLQMVPGDSRESAEQLIPE